MGVVVRSRGASSHWLKVVLVAAIGAALFALPSIGPDAIRAAAGAAQATDTDGDTMPDGWESFFGLDPADAADAALDPDADGLTNAQEYAAGRHPIGRHVRFFAEGATGYFNTELGLVNLSATETAHVSVAFLGEGGGVTTHRLTLDPRARQSLSLGALIGAVAGVSLIVEADVPVASSRSMTWGDQVLGNSLDAGTDGPGTTWYFSEGATGPFHLYYLLENPGLVPASVTIRYLREGASPIVRTRTLPPHSRTTVFVNGDDPGLAAASLGAEITSDQPILAERAMYVVSGGAFAGGSSASASGALRTRWHFAEGAAGSFFNAFLSMLNPSATAATATVTFHLDNGATVVKTYQVAPGRRRTIYLNGEAELDPALAPLQAAPFWFTVDSTQPIVAERAMWWDEWPWYEGHAAAGHGETATGWAVAEGRYGGAAADRTYVLVANTASTAGTIRVTLIPDTGAPQTRDLAIAAFQRLTLDVGGLFALTDARFSVLVEALGSPGVPLVVDAARYRSANGILFSGGGAATAMPIPPADLAPTVTVTAPAQGAANVAPGGNLTVTFSEPVTASAGAFVLECPIGGAIPVTVLTSSPAATFTLDPATDLPLNTVCRLTVDAGAITDADTIDPPDAPAADTIVTFTTSTCAAIGVTPAVVPGGTTGVAYGPVTFAQTGATAPVTWALTAGTLPAGLTLSTAGVLSGTPTEPGSFPVTVRVTDVNACTGATPVTVSILAGPNQAPSFTAGAGQIVLEDSGAQTVAGWATAISPGPSYESGQVVTFTVTGNTNPALFAVAPAVSSTGTLTYTPVANAVASATITLVAQDNGGTLGGGVDTSAPQSFTITVSGINDAPGFTAGASQTVLEDAGAQTVAGWATLINPGPADEFGQTVAFAVTGNTNPALFSAAPAVSPSGTLTYTAAADAAGTATITLALQDNGGTANGGVDTSAGQSFTITVTAVNDAPGFTAGANQTAFEDAGAQTVAGWATALSTGPANESGQALSFGVTGNTNPSLFAVAPAVSGAGTLTYTPAANATGSATITVAAQDDGGTANGGVDTSAGQAFTITVTGVNDAPGFTAGANQTVLEDAGAQTVSGWATAINAGPADEAGQSVTFAVTGNTNPALFSVAPAVSAAGVLTFTGAANAFGSATITLRLQDNGGTANGGVDTSAAQMFTIDITAVNDAPTLTNATITYATAGNTQLHVAGASLAGVASIADASGVLAKSGPTDIESPGSLGVVPFTGATPNGSVVINADGTFTYVPNAGFTGVDAFPFQVTDGVTPVSGTVNLTVSGRVWYVRDVVDANNASGGDGRSTDAFETLALADAASLAGDTIFVFAGNTASTPLTAGIALKDGQRLLGEGVGLALGAFGTIVPAGTQPRLVAAGDAVTVLANGANGSRTGVEIRGLNLISGTGNAIDAASADGAALDVTIASNTITAAGTEGIDVTHASSGQGTLSIHDSVVAGAIGTGIDVLRTAGTLTITAFANNIVTGAVMGSGIVVTGAVTFDATPGGALDPVSGGVTVIGTAGNGVGGSGLVLTQATGSLQFIDLDVEADGGGALSVQGTGAYTGAAGTEITATAGASRLAAINGPAIALDALTANLQAGVISSTNSAASGLSLVNVAGTVTAGIGSAINNAAGTDVTIAGGSATVAYAGTITDDVGQLVSISGTTGSKTFSGVVTDGNDGDGSGISLSNNPGATITFSGGLFLSTGANPAFTATNGGTINVCDDNPCAAGAGPITNSLATTTGTALTVTNTTIGASGLTFRSVSANGAPTGINLSNTGTSGGLTVTGNGAPVSDGSGGTIQNTVGAGITLNNTRNASLRQVTITNPGTDGIRITDIDGFALAWSTIADAVGTAPADKAIDIGDFVSGTPVDGVISITDSVLGPAAGSAPHDTLAIGVSSGTSTWAVTNTTFRNTGNSGIGLELRGTSSVPAFTVSGSTFAGAGAGISARGIFANTLDAAVLTLLTIQDNVFTDHDTHIDLNQQNATGGHTFQILDNATMTGADGNAINVFAAAGAFGGSFTGTVQGNVIGNAGVADSGSAIGNGIRININGGADATMAVTNNLIRQTPFGRGIEIVGRNGTGGLDVTVTGNDVDPQAVSDPLAAIFIQANCAAVCNTVRTDIRGNTVPAAVDVLDVSNTYIILAQAGASTLGMVDTTGPVSGTCATEVAATNTGSTSVVGTCGLIPGPIATP